MSNLGISLIDRYRERWHRSRASRGLVDTTSENFARLGLARVVKTPTVRLLILPADPEATSVEFTEEFWSWWKQKREDPATGELSSLSYDYQPTNSAAVSYYRSGEHWAHYLALDRSAGLELELGRDGCVQEDNFRCFRLIQVVGRTWFALSLYRAVVEHLAVPGPWEVSLAFRNTGDAYLNDVAQGWAPIRGGMGEARKCREPNLLIRIEVAEWPSSPEAIQSLAFSMGARIEDAWGYKERRFIARTGALTGQFDVARY